MAKTADQQTEDMETDMSEKISDEDKTTGTGKLKVDRRSSKRLLGKSANDSNISTKRVRDDPKKQLKITVTGNKDQDSRHITEVQLKESTKSNNSRQISQTSRSRSRSRSKTPGVTPKNTPLKNPPQVKEVEVKKSQIDKSDKDKTKTSQNKTTKPKSWLENFLTTRGSDISEHEVSDNEPDVSEEEDQAEKRQARTKFRTTRNDLVKEKKHRRRKQSLIKSETR